MKPGAFVVVFNSSRTMAQLQVGLEDAGFYARDAMVFRRPSGIPKGFNMAAALDRTKEEIPGNWMGWHSCLRSEWEAIVVVQKPIDTNYYTNIKNHGVGLFHAENGSGAFQGNILEGFARRKKEDFNVHCTPKPIELMERIVKLFVPEGKQHIVLDPFAGSGTTLLAARNLGHDFVGIEIIKDYCDVIEQRLVSTDDVSKNLAMW